MRSTFFVIVSFAATLGNVPCGAVPLLADSAGETEFAFAVLPDGERVVVAGANRVTLYNFDGTELDIPVAVWKPPGDYAQLWYSPDGTQFAGQGRAHLDNVYAKLYPWSPNEDDLFSSCDFTGWPMCLKVWSVDGSSASSCDACSDIYGVHFFDESRIVRVVTQVQTSPQFVVETADYSGGQLVPFATNYGYGNSLDWTGDWTGPWERFCGLDSHLAYWLPLDADALEELDPPLVPGATECVVRAGSAEPWQNAKSVPYSRIWTHSGYALRAETVDADALAVSVGKLGSDLQLAGPALPRTGKYLQIVQGDRVGHVALVHQYGPLGDATGPPTSTSLTAVHLVAAQATDLPPLHDGLEEWSDYSASVMATSRFGTSLLIRLQKEEHVLLASRRADGLGEPRVVFDTQKSESCTNKVNLSSVRIGEDGHTYMRAAIATPMPGEEQRWGIAEFHGGGSECAFVALPQHPWSTIAAAKNYANIPVHGLLAGRGFDLANGGATVLALDAQSPVPATGEAGWARLQRWDRCEPGFSSPTGWSPCAPCPAGTFQPESGAGECRLCAVGTHSEVASVSCSKDGDWTPPGDVSANGAFDVVDVQCALLALLADLSELPWPPCLDSENPTWDFNCDQSLDVADIISQIGSLLGSASPLGTCAETACQRLDCDVAGSCESQAVDCPTPEGLCHAFVCEETRGCVPQETNCSDGNSCTVDRCEVAQGCMHEPVICEDGNSCVHHACDPAIGCTYSHDQDCNGVSACLPVGCFASKGCAVDVSGFAADFSCSDGLACTEDSCMEPIGCVFTPHDELCADDDGCFSGVCTQGVGCELTPSPDADCDDGNPCTLDSCEAKGCYHQLVQATCDDGDDCPGDFCVAGQCEPWPCESCAPPAPASSEDCIEICTVAGLQGDVLDCPLRYVSLSPEMVAEQVFGATISLRWDESAMQFAEIWRTLCFTESFCVELPMPVGQATTTPGGATVAPYPVPGELSLTLAGSFVSGPTDSSLTPSCEVEAGPLSTGTGMPADVFGYVRFVLMEDTDATEVCAHTEYPSHVALSTVLVVDDENDRFVAVPPASALP